MTEALAQHLRDVWSYEGLEVTGVSPSAVSAAVGPRFPISELCMDVGSPDRFDAVVTMNTNPTGVVLTIEPCREPPVPSLTLPVLVAAVLSVVGAASMPRLVALVSNISLTM